MNKKDPHLEPFRSILLVLVAALLVACGREPRQLGLSDQPTEEAAPPGEEDEAERRRLTEMQLVRFTDADGNEHSMPVTQVAGALFHPSTLDSSACYDVCPQYHFTNLSDEHCLDAACQVRQDICVARALQNVATVRATPYPLGRAYIYDGSGDREDGSNYAPVDGTFHISPQTVSVRAALLRHSLFLAKAALGKIAFALGPYTGTSMKLDGACRLTAGNAEHELPWMTTTQSDSAAGLAAETLVDASSLIEELGQDLTEAILAAADAQRSRSLSLEQGVARSVAGAELSRAEAAHQLVGGSPGLLGSTGRAFCSSPELSGRARTAVGIIRRAAPSPAIVKDTNVHISTFLNGTVTGFPSGSVGVRIAYLDGQCVTVSGACPIA